MELMSMGHNLRDMGYSNVCCRCGMIATEYRVVKELRVDLGDSNYILRHLCSGCVDSFESMYRKWWEKKPC